VSFDILARTEFNNAWIFFILYAVKTGLFCLTSFCFGAIELRIVSAPSVPHFFAKTTQVSIVLCVSTFQKKCQICRFRWASKTIGVSALAGVAALASRKAVDPAKGLFPQDLSCYKFAWRPLCQSLNTVRHCRYTLIIFFQSVCSSWRSKKMVTYKCVTALLYKTRESIAVK